VNVPESWGIRRKGKKKEFGIGMCTKAEEGATIMLKESTTRHTGVQLTGLRAAGVVATGGVRDKNGGML